MSEVKSTIIQRCHNCAQNKIEHPYQDRVYGKYMRLFNVGEKSGQAVCTVCANGKKLK